MTQARWGITVPFAGVPLSEHRPWFEELVDLGFTDIWSSEAGAHDAFTVLALAAAWTPALRLGQAVVPVYTRGPALLAQTIASLIEAAPGRVAVGIGTSSNVIVERWNGIPFERPYHHVRDTLRFLRVALSGEKVTEEYETFSVKGFRLGVRVEQQPPILVGALRPGMLRLAGREGDGAIINWLSAEDVRTVAPIVGPDKEIVARIFVLPSEDRDAVRHLGRRMIAEYLNVPVYAAFHDWLGRGDLLRPMWDAWKAGDRAGATEVIPDEVLDQLVVHGSPEECAEHVRRYVDAGVTTPMPMILAAPDRTKEVLRALSRRIAPGIARIGPTVGAVEATTSGIGTKELIIEVARRRFAENGFAATSLTEIADEVGIRRPSLLHHFPSKEALYQDVLRSDLADWETLVTDAVADPAEGWPQVERVVRAAFRFFEEHPEFVRLIRREALDGGPMLSEQLKVVLRPMFDRGVLFLQVQMDAGKLRPYDARQLLLTGYGAALSYLSDAPLIESLLDGDPLSPAALQARREHVLDVLRNALEP